MSTAHKPPPARNYGQKHSGGDTYSMGMELNTQIALAWADYRHDLQLQHENPGSALVSAWVRRDKAVLRALMAVRKAGRAGVGNEQG